MTFDLRPSQKIVMAAAPYVLIEEKSDPVMTYCWYRDGGPGYVASFRKDSLIYVAGFDTKDRAIAHAEKEGWIEL